MSDSNNIKRLLTALCTPMQTVEDAYQQLLTERSIDTAVGAQLIIIGRIVGQPYAGEDYEVYRRLCRARVAANRSFGRVTDMIKIATLVVYDDAANYHVELQGDACFVLRIEDVATPEDTTAVLIRFLLDAVSAGVRPIVESSALEPATWFEWDTDGLGWDEGFFIGAVDSV